MNQLQDKVAIITGGSAGIGKAAAELFAQEGAKLVINGREPAALAAVVETIVGQGGDAVAVPGDVGDEAVQRKLVETATERFGRLDVAFNNAGTPGPGKTLIDVTTAEWDEVLRTNLTSAFLAARCQIPAMLRSGGGSIIFTASFVGVSAGLPGMAPYGAAKAGIVGLVKGITADHAADGIRANALLPGGTDTAMAGTKEQKAWAAGLHAVKRIAEPGEIAEAALFLASDRSSFVLGSALSVDGGNSAIK